MRLSPLVGAAHLHQLSRSCFQDRRYNTLYVQLTNIAIILEACVLHDIYLWVNFEILAMLGMG